QRLCLLFKHYSAETSRETGGKMQLTVLYSLHRESIMSYTTCPLDWGRTGMTVDAGMTPEAFAHLVAGFTAQCAGRPLDAALEQRLNDLFPAGGQDCQALLDACRAACAAGWMCNREAGGIRYGRGVKPGPGTHGFSVAVVDMAPVVRPHHRHPEGEIDLVMPLEDGARFDGRGAGWLVYGPGSAHHPTVT